MSFIYGTTLAADLFRISYQGIEAAADQTSAQNLTLSERIGQTMKRHIALLEIYLTVQHYIFGVDRFKEWVIPFRVVAIGQGIYELQTNPQADIQSIGHDILLNLVHIGSIATRTLNSQISTALLLGDAFYRIFRLISERTAIADRMKDLYHQIAMHQVWNGMVKTADYVGRTALFSAFLAQQWIYLNVVCHADQFCENLLNQLQGKPPSAVFKLLSLRKASELCAWGICGIGLTSLFRLAFHQIFDEIGLQQSQTRVYFEQAVSLMSASTLLCFTAVGLGRASSFIEIVKPIYPTIFALALGCIIGYLFNKAIEQLLDQIGVQSGVLRTLEKWIITIVSTVTLTVFASVGLGLSKTIQDTIAKIAIYSLSAACGFYIINGIALDGRTLLLGMPSHHEIIEWMIGPKVVLWLLK